MCLMPYEPNHEKTCLLHFRNKSVQISLPIAQAYFSQLRLYNLSSLLLIIRNFKTSGNLGLVLIVKSDNVLYLSLKVVSQILLILFLLLLYI